ncbi:MAG: ATP-dependent DNA helicase [Candidatus Hadarchaeales archaeon]
MKISELIDYGLPEEVVEILKKHGIEELYPPQAECVRKGVLGGKSMVVCIPTAAGKTLVAELCMLKHILGGGKALYIVPLRALASEKYEEFKEKYSALGVKVGISTGDYDTADPRLASYDLLIATSERVDSLLRHRAKWLADLISVAVLDEVHLLGDPGRGPTLEVLTARLRQVNPGLQLVALSATVRNSGEVAEWLGAELVESEWRPVPLRKGVYFKGKIRFDDGTERKVREKGNPIHSLVTDTLSEGGQVLIFLSTRRSAQSLASLLAEGLSLEVERELLEVADRIERALDEPTRTCRLLASCVRRGVAFHHAGLHMLQRREVEQAFREGLIKVLCATPTLAMGVNLPARRVIIRDYRRYSVEHGAEFIPVLEFHQLCGRAGRPKYDKFGEALLLAEGEEEAEALFEGFINSPPERLVSKLAAEPALRSHVLACIASGYAESLEGLIDFFSHTFFSYQRGVKKMVPLLERVLEFLSEEGMVTKRGENLLATEFGQKVSALYIDPLSAVNLRDGVKGATSAPTDFSLLHLICHTPDMPLLGLGRDAERYEALASSRAEEFLLPLPDPSDEVAYEYFLREVKTARMLEEWVEEESEDAIHDTFGVGAGDIRRMAETAEWLLYSAHELAKLFRARKVLAPLRELQVRVRYGIKRELLELVQLRGIGRVRARSLFEAGYRGLSDIRKATEAELSRVPHLGPELARSIKKQVES